MQVHTLTINLFIVKIENSILLLVSFSFILTQSKIICSKDATRKYKISLKLFKYHTIYTIYHIQASGIYIGIYIYRHHIHILYNKM